MIMDIGLIERYFNIAFNVKEKGKGQPINPMFVKDFVKSSLNLKTDKAVENNLNFLIAKGFLVRGSMGNIGANPNLDEEYAMWKKKCEKKGEKK